MPKRRGPSCNTSNQRHASLQFLPSGSREGFVSQAVSTDNISNPSEIVRELIQNSLDAGNEAGRKQIHIKFEITEIPVEDIPGINEYKIALSAAKTAHKESFETAEAILEGIDNQLKKKNILVLNVIDNGIGLDSERMNSLLSDGMTSKTGKSSDSGGSYGVGHYTAFPASYLQYVMYGGITKSKVRTMSGHAILASHRIKKSDSTEETLGKDGYYIVSQDKTRINNSYTFATGEHLPKFTSELLDKIEQDYSNGSVVSIIGFNNFKLKTSEAEAEIKKAVVRSFFMPIYDGRLLVTCGSERITPTVLEDELKKHQSQKRKNIRTDVINGHWAYGHFLTYKLTNPKECHSSSEVVKIYFRDAKPDESTRIAIYRQGMFISDQVPKNRPKDFAKYQPFNAVIEVEPTFQDNENPAFQLIRKAEGTKHLELDASRLKNEFQERFNDLFDQINKKLKELCTENTEEYYSPPQFLLNLSSLNFVNSKTRRTKEFANPSEQQELIPMEEGSAPQGEGKKKSAKKKGWKNQHRRISRTPCQFVASAKREFQDLQLRIRPEEDINNAHLSIHVHSGSDATCAYPLSDRKIRFENKAEGTRGWSAESLGKLSAGNPINLSLKLTDTVPGNATLKIAIDDIDEHDES